MPTFNFVKQVDCGALHKLLIQNGFDVVGVSFDSGTNITTVQLADTETKDPTATVNSYIFVPYVPINWTQLYNDAVVTVTSAKNTVEIAKGILQDDLGLYNSANTNLSNAQGQYNTAAGNYTTATTTYGNAGTPVNNTNAVAHLVAAESQIVSLASACQALLGSMQAQAGINSVFLSAFSQIVNVLGAHESVNDAQNSVIEVLARRVNVLEDED
jgi:hypothetical protein